jgi:hypothetical protein
VWTGTEYGKTRIRKGKRPEFPIGPAKLNGLDLAYYLSTVLARIAEHSINRIKELLPWNVAAPIQTDTSQAA